MEIYIARQPIFNTNMEIVAYELLYRSGATNSSSSSDDAATSSVIVNGLLMFGLETLAENRRAFIKFTRTLLLDEMAMLLPSGQVALEVLENFESDARLIRAIRQLKLSGYRIVLDEYVDSETLGDVLTLADVIKVDFSRLSLEEIRKIASDYAGTRIQLLAEKVETHEQYELARKLGYALFQGYFFAKPYLSASKDIRSLSASHVRLLSELSEPEPDYARISAIIESDLSLAYKILKLVNTGAYLGSGRITSIRQALVRLGMKELGKWLSLVLMRDAGDGKPEVLVRSAMIRARAMEELAETTGNSARKTEFFLVGIFSLIDVILERSMQSIVEELPLGEDIKVALTGEQNLLRMHLEIVTAYEAADWDAMERLREKVETLTDERVIVAYMKAIQWVKGVFEEQPA